MNGINERDQESRSHYVWARELLSVFFEDAFREETDTELRNLYDFISEKGITIEFKNRKVTYPDILLEDRNVYFNVNTGKVIYEYQGCDRAQKYDYKLYRNPKHWYLIDGMVYKKNFDRIYNASRPLPVADSWKWDGDKEAGKLHRTYNRATPITLLSDIGAIVIGGSING